MGEICVFLYKVIQKPQNPVFGVESAQTDRLYRQVNGTANPFAKKEEEEKTIIFLFAFLLAPTGAPLVTVVYYI